MTPLGPGSHRKRQQGKGTRAGRLGNGAASGAGTDSILEDLVADQQIRQVLARYCRGVDRGDVALLKSVYHEDAVDDHGSFKGSGFAFAEHIVELMADLTIPSQHHVTNVLIERDGDTAHVESYVLAYHPIPDPKAGAGRQVHALFGGRYLDRFEKRGGAWKISSRQVVMDWTRERLLGEVWELERAFQGARGARGDDDPSSEMF